VREALRSLAGDDVWRRTTPVSARGRVERIGERYRLTLAVREGSVTKERRIESDSCADLGGAAAVTLGLLLKRGPTADATSTEPAATSTEGAPEGTTPSSDPNTSTRAAVVGQTKPRANPESSAGDHQEDSADASDSGRARRLRLSLRAPLVSLDLARLPAPSFGLGGGVGARYAAWSFVVVGRYLLPQTLWAEQFPDTGTRVSRFSVELWSCRGWRRGPLELAPCLTVGVEHLTARAVGPPNVIPIPQRSTAALMGGAGALHYYLADWSAVFLGAGIGFATARPSLSIAGLGEIGRVGPVQVSVGIGSEWIF